MHYYHAWLIFIPHLLFLRGSTAECDCIPNEYGRQQEDDADSCTLFTSSAEVLSIVSSPPVVLARRKLATSTNTSTTPGREARRISLLESHLKTVEKIQIEAVAQRKSKDN